VTFILCVIQIHLYLLTVIRTHTRQQFLKLTVGLGLSLDLGLAVCVFCHFLRAVCSYLVRFNFFSTKKARKNVSETTYFVPNGTQKLQLKQRSAMQRESPSRTSISRRRCRLRILPSHAAQLRGLHRPNVDAAIYLSARLAAMRQSGTSWLGPHCVSEI